MFCTALAALSARPDENGAQAVVQLLAPGKHWSLRRQAAQALEQMGKAASAQGVVAALTRAAQADPYALVRDAAARALFAIDPGASREVLERLRRSDAEERVRETARQLLERKP